MILIPVYSGSSHRGKNFVYRNLTSGTGMIITGGMEIACFSLQSLLSARGALPVYAEAGVELVTLLS